MHWTPLLWLNTLVSLYSLTLECQAWSLGRTEQQNAVSKRFWKSTLQPPPPSNDVPILDLSSSFHLPKQQHRSTGTPETSFDGESATESPKESPKAESKKRHIRNVQELRTAVLDDGLELKQTQLIYETATLGAKELLNHDVIQLLSERAKTNSLPGHRKDNATLALALEGGGMRGAVSAGMAAAIASLGLCDAFDSIYGSSAGSVVGAYFVSRQMCVDVYTSVLPAAQRKFVCKKRMMAGIMANAVDLILGRMFASSKLSTPGMNISFVLDGIMHHDYGLRPLDMESFRQNDRIQPLRIATSCAQNGKLSMKCLGTKDFFDHVDPVTNQTVRATVRADDKREGLYACLEAGMTVPGATGPPVMLRDGNNVTSPCFDAFCFEPLPYRSAVEDGATHVLVLRSRPECFQAKTSPGVYEKGVAPIYFRSHGEEQVARFFEKGGQQYIYLEDILTLEEGRLEGVKSGGHGVAVPPTTILYGVEKDDVVSDLAANRDSWKRAHLLPVTVPKGTPELPTLEQRQEAVVEAVRGGFAAAFDLLAPAAGLDLESGMTGERVAKLVFPTQAIDSVDFVLQEQVSVRGHSIDALYDEPKRRRRKRLAIKNLGRRLAKGGLRLAKPFRRQSVSPVPDMLLDTDTETLERCHREDAEALLGLLPGIQNGNLPPISEGLHYCRAMETLL